MKHCLVDINVILALLVRRHDHHRLARTWFEGLEAGEAGICRIVQLGIVRLLGNRNILGDQTLDAASGWRVMADLLDDERLDLVPEPAGLDTLLPAFMNHAVLPGKLVTDAYLASFARAADRKMVTLDRDFQRFRGLEVELLAE